MAKALEAKKPKKQKTTLEKAKAWKRGYLALKAGQFASPIVPFGVILGINWSDWFGAGASEGWSIGLGFGMLAVATVLAIAEVMRKDELVKTKVSFVFYISIVFVLVGFSFKLLASIMNEMGNYFLYIACGLLGGGGIDQINQAFVRPKSDFYANLVEENGLDKSSARKLLDAEQAKKEGEEKRKQEKRDRGTYV